MELDIDGIRLPAKAKKATHTSALCRGLTLVVMPKRKVWVWRYTRLDGRRNSITLGDWPALSETEAAEAATGHRALLKRGIDPVEAADAAKQQARAQRFAMGQAVDARWRFSTLAGEFLAHCEKTIRPSSVSQYRKSLNVHLLPVLGSADIRYIDVPAYEEMILGIASKSKSAAAQAHAAARAALSYAVDRHLIPVNPLLGKRSLVKRTKVAPRRDYLSSQNLHRFLHELQDQKLSADAKTILRLQLLSGLRVGELCALEWAWIDFRGRVIAIPEHVMKAGEGVEIVMSDAMRRTLLEWKRIRPGDGRVFAPEIATNKVVDEVRTLNWIRFTTHSIRRTVRTHLQNLGCPEEIRKSISNHTAPAGIAKHYDHARLRAAKLHWLTVWAEALERVKVDALALADDIDAAEDDDLLAEFRDVL